MRLVEWIALVAVPLVAACGDKVHHGVDAGPIDARVDALVPSDDPPPGAVTLTITRGGAPVAGISVIFQAADSSLVHAALTNDNGIAWAMMPSGGFVTAVESRGAKLDELTTFAGVAPADALVLAIDPAGPRDAWPVALSIPADAGATSYQVFTTCGGPIGADPSAATETMLLGCGGAADAVVVTADADGGLLNAFFAGSVAVPEPVDTDPPTFMPLALSGSYAPLVPATFSYSNVPSSVTTVATYHAFASARGRVFERTAAEAVSGNGATTVIPLPSAMAPSLVATTLYAPEIGTQTIFEAASPPYALDVGAARLPGFATAPAFAAGAPGAAGVISWTEDAGAVQPELVRARIHAYRDDIPAGRAWGWRIVAPRSGTAIAYPVLPSFGFDFNPASSDVVGVDELTTAAVPGDYSARIGLGELGMRVVGTSERAVVQILTAVEP